LFDLHLHRCSGRRCGGADTWSDAQENLFHADADTTPEKEKHERDKKEITNSDAHSKSIGDFITKEKTFTGC
jgi:hypothetical protein